MKKPKIFADSEDLRFPDFNDKKDFHQSGITTFRMRSPTNTYAASKFSNMIFDHSKQMGIWPDGKPNSLIEATRSTGDSQYKTMNKSGRPYALGVMVGGSPDVFMDSFKKAPKAKILK